MSEPWERYGWLDDDDILECFCLSVAVGADPAQAVAAFGADPASQAVLPIHDAWLSLADWDNEVTYGADSVVQIGMLDGQIVILEPAGAVGMRNPVATALSQRGRYASFWQGLGPTWCLYAMDGRVIREFEPLFQSDDDPAERLPEEAGLPFDVGRCSKAAMVLIERLTGVAISKEAFMAPRPSYRRSDEVITSSS
jgi:hypothetical protein